MLIVRVHSLMIPAVKFISHTLVAQYDLENGILVLCANIARR